MKFEEKLMKLRKERALSQEELGEKLNVTRQTVSKWELGQSKPEMDKLVEISKFFNVSLEDLTNDEGDIEKKEDTIKTNSTKGEKKYILIILIIVGVVAIGLLIWKLFGGLFVVNEAKGVFDSAFGIINSVKSDLDNKDNIPDTANDFFGIMQNNIQQYNEQLEQMDKEEQEKMEIENKEEKQQEQQEQFNQQVNQMLQLEQMLQQYKGF